MILNGAISSTPDSAIINNGTLSHSSANATILSIRIANSGSFVNSGDLTVNGLFTCDNGVVNATGTSVFVSILAFFLPVYQNSFDELKAFSGQPLTLTNSCQLGGSGTFAFRTTTTLAANLAAASIEVAGDVSFTNQNILKLLFTSGSITGTSIIYNLLLSQQFRVIFFEKA